MTGDEPPQASQGQANSPEAKLKKVREWLMKAGYPLEMRVTRAFTLASTFNRVVMGEIYQPSDPAEPQRAIDVVAQKGVILYRPEAFNGAGVSMFADLLTVVECKSNPKGNRPWIVFSDPTEVIDPTFKLAAHRGSALGEWLLRELYNEELHADLPLFAAPRVGYSVTCALLGDNNPNPRENNQDTAYEAVMEVLSAARAKADVQSSQYRTFRIVIPVIVVAADLYQAWLGFNGELQLQPRDEMALLYKTKPSLDPGAHSMIYIVTEKKLPDLIGRIEHAHTELFRDEELLLRGCDEIQPDPEPPEHLR